LALFAIAGHKPTSIFFNLITGPLEGHDLITDPAQQDRLAAMRRRLQKPKAAAH